MRRKGLHVILCLVLTAMLAVPGCSSKPSGVTDTGGPAGTKEENAATGQGEIKLEFLSCETDEQLAVLKEIINTYNETNTDNITVELTAPSDYENLMKTKMAANNLPDIFGTHGWAVRRYDEYLYDLSNESWASEIDPAIESIIRDSDGKLCALPIAQANEGIQFNLDVIEKYDIDIHDLETMEKFEAALEKIKTESGGEVVPVYMAGSDASIIGFFMNSLAATNIGGSPVSGADALTTGEEFDWSQITAVLTELKKMADNGYLNDDYLTAQVPDMIQAIVEGRCAFIYLGNAVMTAASATAPDLRWGFMPYPTMPELGCTEPALVNGEKITYGIWKDSENVDAARKVLEYLAQEENVKALCAAVFAPSGFLNSEADLGSLNEYYNMWKDVKNVGQFDRTYMPNGVYDTWADATSKVLMGSYTPDEATDLIKAEYDRLFKAE